MPVYGFSPADKGIVLIGDRRISVELEGIRERAVQPDSLSGNHLYIIDYDADGKVVRSTRCFFDAQYFDLSQVDGYIDNGVLGADGEQRVFYADGGLRLSTVYERDQRVAMTEFYDDGKKSAEMHFADEWLDGDFIMWYKNGQVSFKGKYKENDKEGLFYQFDESGKLIASGYYQEGELADGQHVVPDLEWENPDDNATFEGGDEALSTWLYRKTRNHTALKGLTGEKPFELTVKLRIDRLGAVTEVLVSSVVNDQIASLVKEAFVGIPDFHPALVEETGVRSILALSLLVDSSGLRVNADDEDESSE